MTAGPTTRWKALPLLVLLAAGPAVAQEPPDTLRTLLADGEIGLRTGATGALTLYRYEVYQAPDSIITVQLQKEEIQIGAGATLTAQQAAEASNDAPFVIPLNTLRLLLSNVDEYENVPNSVPLKNLEMGIEADGRVVFGIRRSMQGELLLLIVVLVGSLGVAGVFFAQSRRERRARLVLLEAQRAATASREAERLRIARDLHDGPVQQLHGLRLRLNTGAGPSDREAFAADEVQSVVQEVRTIAENLRPPSLGPFGVAAALETLAERVGEQHPHVTVIADVEPGGVEPEGDVPLALFRIAQEAMNNAVEHAEPSVLVLRYRSVPLHLEITDDGVGFAWPRDLGALRRAGHFGVVGIAERVELIGGKLEVSAGPGGGTRLRVTR